MNREDLYVKELMQELPREKAPANITQLIMQKIEKKTEFVFVKPLPLWQNSNIYLLLGVIVAELLLLWLVSDMFTFENVLFVGKTIYSSVIRYIATPNFNNLFFVLALIGVAIYFFVSEHIENNRRQFFNSVVKYC